LLLVFKAVSVFKAALFFSPVATFTNDLSRDGDVSKAAKLHTAIAAMRRLSK
jgi:hypothetical protein